MGIGQIYYALFNKLHSPGHRKLLSRKSWCYYVGRIGRNGRIGHIGWSCRSCKLYHVGRVVRVSRVSCVFES